MTVTSPSTFRRIFLQTKNGRKTRCLTAHSGSGHGMELMRNAVMGLNRSLGLLLMNATIIYIEGPYDGDLTIEEDAIFDDNPASFGMTQQSPDEDIAPAGAIPSALAGAFMRVPDSFDGTSKAEWRSDDAEIILEEEKRLEDTQHVLVLLADRQACERGWVLFLGINHKVRVMPLRIRHKARDTRDQVNQWLGLGHGIDAAPEDRTDEVIYADDGDGWDEC